MTIDTLDTLSGLIEEQLREAEQNGLERDAVARRLEEHAAAVRDGYVSLPHRRGEWWNDVHNADVVEHREAPAVESD